MTIFIAILTVLFLLWGLIWDRSDHLNIIVKTSFFLWSFAGAWILLHPHATRLPFFILVGLFTLWIAVPWKTKDAANVLFKISWYTISAICAYQVIKLT
jgi:hypothetical protein